jgi:hypothetical protein
MSVLDTFSAFVVIRSPQQNLGDAAAMSNRRVQNQESQKTNERRAAQARP